MNEKKSINDEIEKINKMLQYWIVHNNEHILENETWFKNISELGLTEIAEELKPIISYTKESNKCISSALKKLKNLETQNIDRKIKKQKSHVEQEEHKYQKEFTDIHFTQIGIIHTPYIDSAPYQPVDNDKGNFTIIVDPEYTNGLAKLDRFNYIYVLYYLHKINRKPKMIVSPPWVSGNKVGVFASRSPVRPNQLGLSIVRLKKIVGNVIYTSGLDVFDGTPLLDIKPYIKDLDSKTDANYGWIESEKDWEHLILHIRGIPHDH